MSMNTLTKDQWRERMFVEPGVPATWVCEHYRKGESDHPCNTGTPHKNIWCQFYTREEIEEREHEFALEQLNSEIPPIDIPPSEEVRRAIIEEKVAAYRAALLELDD